MILERKGIGQVTLIALPPNIVREGWLCQGRGSHRDQTVSTSEIIFNFVYNAIPRI